VGRVVEPIEGSKLGRIAIDGDVWQATAGDGSSFSVGEQVVITAVNSIIVTVKHKE
jgi:membrane protein implicated in regulation of membrane protease activity